MSFKSSSSIEEYNYNIIKKIADLEIRDYQNALFLKVELHSDKYEKMSSNGFRILSGYIFGENKRSEQISMTSPVWLEMGATKSMMFMVPKNTHYLLFQSRTMIILCSLRCHQKKMAAIQFGGWANQKK
tara:strand:+ start:75 stop:461 length:387 start_codon:yes stop_codon:yes gene_type:complete